MKSRSKLKMSWLMAPRLCCRDLVLMTAPVLVIFLLCKDLIDLYRPDSMNYYRSFGGAAWGFRSRGNFILNHLLHMALPLAIIAAHFLPPACFPRLAGRCRRIARAFAALYNAAILSLVVYYFAAVS